MNYRNTIPVVSAVILALAAGAAATAHAQNTTPASRDAVVIASTVDFRSCHWLTDRKVVNNNGEEIAEVSDLILDRGTGRVEYVVVKTGSLLGMGGRAVAIPFGALKWESGGKNRFILASTAEQLKAFPEYSAESWKSMKDSPKDDQGALRQKLAADAATPGDPYAGNLDTAGKQRVEGEITKVERVRTSTFGEQIVITVQPTAGDARRVALGPSWYVNGAPAAPMRGETVVVDTLTLPRDPDRLLAGTHIRTGNRELHLRDTDGSPAWALKTVASDGRVYSTPYSRYLLLSNLPGAKIDCRGSECGKIHDILLDRYSGEIGFLSIDPNQNFLGISDTKRLIPWSVATVTLDGTVRIDASKEMVLASPETPADLSVLSSGTHADRVYKAFDVPLPHFAAPKPVSAAPSEGIDAWSAGGSIIAAMERDSIRMFEGKVIDITDITFDKGVRPARAVKIRIAGDGKGEETILLGPAWYMDNQKPLCDEGDSIKIDAHRTTIDGRAYWIAHSIDRNGTRVVLLDGNNVPAWSQP